MTRPASGPRRRAARSATRQAAPSTLAPAALPAALAPAAVALAALGLFAAACSDDDTAAPDRTTTTTEPAPTTTVPDATTTEPAPTTTVPLDERPAPLPDRLPELRLVPVATAQAPTAMVIRPGTGLLYVAERAGRVRVLDPVTGDLGPPLLDISDEVRTDGERGLLGLAFSADGDLLYLHRSDLGGDNVVEEYPLDGEAVDSAGRRTVLAVDQPASNHNGGDIHVGPDGMLWIALGDGGGQGDPFDNAQDTSNLLGTVVRIDPTARDAGAYGIPEDNPFAQEGGRPEIWVYGLRNPWRISFDSLTGDLWIADVGERTAEEINFLPAPDRGRGANLEWPVREGFRSFRGGTLPAHAMPPIHDYARVSPRCSITGGHVYRGDAIEGLNGAYVFGDLCDGVVRALYRTPDGVESRAFDARTGRLVSFTEGPDGELYTVSLDGPISRLEAEES